MTGSRDYESARDKYRMRKGKLLLMFKGEGHQTYIIKVY
jgi:hypothetical protein